MATRSEDPARPDAVGRRRVPAPKPAQASASAPAASATAPTPAGAPPRSSAPAAARAVTPGVRVASEWAWRLGVIALALYGLSLLIREFSQIFVPLVIALLVSALLYPLVNRFSVLVPRGVAALVTLLGTLLVVIGLFSLVAQQATTGFPQLQAQGLSGLQDIRNWLRTGPLNINVDTIGSYVNKAENAASANGGQVVSGAVSVASRATHLGEGFFVVMFSTFFFLSSGHRIWAWVLRIFPRSAQRPLDDAARSGWVTLTHYVRATLIVALVDGIGIGTGSALLGVPLALPLGVLVFLGAFIPILGALVTGALAVLVALVANGPVIALAVLGVVILVNQLEAHVMQPFLLGRAVDVHPLAVILAIVAGSTIAGIVGALFAVPLVAVANTMISSLASRGRDNPGDRIVAEDAPFSPGEPAATNVDHVPDPQRGTLSDNPRGA